MCGVALKRPARQISVFTDGIIYHTADIGNDGLFDDPDDESDYGLATWVGSLLETNPWWMVDLGIELNVTEVILTNRKHWGKADFRSFIVPRRSHFLANLELRPARDCYGLRGHNLKIFVYRSRLNCRKYIFSQRSVGE